MKKELLFSVTKKDLEIDYFSGTGAGGQYRNKHQNCVRIRHKESGAIVTGQSHRERSGNIKEAMNGLIENSKFKLWMSKKILEVTEGKKIEDIVEEKMKPENLKVEYKYDGGWMEEE